jgi:hypothetical protein
MEPVSNLNSFQSIHVQRQLGSATPKDSMLAVQSRLARLEAACSGTAARMAGLEATMAQLQAASQSCAQSWDALRRYPAAAPSGSPWPLSLFLYPFARAARWLMDMHA